MVRALSPLFVGGHLPALISQRGRQRFVSKISFIRMLIPSTVTLLSGYNHHHPPHTQSLHFITLSKLGFQHMHLEETSIHSLVYVIEYRRQDHLVEKGSVYNQWHWGSWTFAFKKWSLPKILPNTTHN